MECWKGDFHRGIHALARHDPAAAAMYLSRALKECPVSSRRSLSRLLFYLGVALQRLGLSNSAIRAWIASQRSRKLRRNRELLQRYANPYGMAKQGCDDLDDWQAFYSLQLTRYLRGFNKRTLTSATERSMLQEIIRERWTALKQSGVLEGRSPEEKSVVFRATRIDYPLFYMSDEKDPVLQVNFETGKKFRPGDRCFCGSGLPFLACCGRTPGEDELSIGIF
jgi:uncharacterized protein YchJ